jgi:hypothetical protein
MRKVIYPIIAVVTLLCSSAHAAPFQKLREKIAAKREFKSWVKANPIAHSDLKTAKTRNGAESKSGLLVGAGMAAMGAAVTPLVGPSVANGTIAMGGMLITGALIDRMGVARKSRTDTVRAAIKRGDAPSRETLRRWRAAGVVAPRMRLPSIAPATAQ